MSGDEDMSMFFGTIFDDSEDTALYSLRSQRPSNFDSRSNVEKSSLVTLSGLAGFKPLPEVIERRRGGWGWSSRSGGGDVNSYRSAPPAERLPAVLDGGLCGLRNQGATCYLNSLIQALYLTPELRNRLYSLDPEKDLGLNPLEDSVVKHLERDAAAEAAAAAREAGHGDASGISAGDAGGAGGAGDAGGAGAAATDSGAAASSSPTGPTSSGKEEVDDGGSSGRPQGSGYGAAGVGGSYTERKQRQRENHSGAFFVDLHGDVDAAGLGPTTVAQSEASESLFSGAAELGFSESQLAAARERLRNPRSVDEIVEYILTLGDDDVGGGIDPAPAVLPDSGAIATPDGSSDDEKQPSARANSPVNETPVAGTHPDFAEQLRAAFSKPDAGLNPTAPNLDNPLFAGLSDLGFSEEQISAARAAMHEPNSADEIIQWIFSHADEIATSDAVEYSDMPALIPVDEVSEDPGLRDTDIGSEASAARAELEGTFSADNAVTVDGMTADERIAFAENSGDAVVSSAEPDMPSLMGTNAPVDSDSSTLVVPEKKKKSNKRIVIIELQRLFAWLQLVNQQATTTEWLTNSFGWQGNQVYVQHDIHELNRLLFDAIERSLVRTEQQSVINDMFRGLIANRIVCKKCGHVSAREEPFLDVSLLVRDKDTICDSLAAYTEQETLEGENQYSCETCEEKVDATKGAVFRSLPDVLQFSMIRFEYDWNADKRVKISTPCKFPLVLNMDPYTEEGVVGVDASGTPTPATIAKGDEIPDGDKEAPLEGDEKSSTTANQGPLLWQQQYTEEGKNLYDLFAVLIHIGGAYGGHYHSYIRVPSHSHNVPAEGDDFFPCGHSMDEPDNQWFDFNDSNVTAIPQSKIASQYSAVDEGAYMLVYRRRELTIAPGPDVSPPQFFRDELELHNTRLQRERDDYDDTLFEVEFSFVLEAGFALENKEIDGRQWPVLRDSNTIADGPTTLEIYFDIRKPLRDLISAVCDMLGDDYELPKALTQCTKNSATNSYYVFETLTLDDKQLARPLSETALREKMKLLLWNGSSLNGLSWDGSGAPIAYTVRHFSPKTVPGESAGDNPVAPEVVGDDAPPNSTQKLAESTPPAFEINEFTVVLAETNTLSQLQQEISSRTGITAERQHLCRMTRSYGRFLLRSIPQDEASAAGDAGKPPSLFARGLCDEQDIVLTVEERAPEEDENPSRLADAYASQQNDSAMHDMFDFGDKPPSSRAVTFSSLAQAHLDASKDTWEIFVENAMESNSTDATALAGCNTQQDSIRVFIADAKNASVRELKLLILEKLGYQLSQDELSNVRLSKFLIGGGIGEPYEEAKGLSSAGIRPSERVVIEVGEPVVGDEEVAPTITFDDIKLRFDVGVGGEQDDRYSDGSSRKTFEVSVLRQDTLSFVKTKMLDALGETGGDALLKQWRLWRTDVYDARLENALTVEQEARTCEQLGVRGRELLFLENKPPNSAGDITVHIDVMTHTSPAEVGSHSIFAELTSPSVVFSNGIRNVRQTGEPVSDSHLASVHRLETLFPRLEVNCEKDTLDDLLAKIRGSDEWRVWCEQAGMQSGSSIRIWRGDALLRKHKSALRRQGVSKDNTILTVECATDDAIGTCTDDAMLLYVQEHIGGVDNTAEQVSSRCFSSPPRAVWFLGTTVNSLREQVSAAHAADTPLAIAKLNRFNGTWQIVPQLSPDSSSTGPQQQQQPEKAKGCRGGQNPLRQKPYYLRDGDTVIVACDSYNKEKDVPVTVAEHEEWFRSLNLARRIALRGGNAGGGGNPGKKRGKKGSSGRGENEGNASANTSGSPSRPTTTSSSRRSYEPVLAIDVGDFSE